MKDTLEVKPLTITVNYYNQAEFLADLVGRWQKFPAELLNQVCFVVIDDGSSVSAESVLASIPPQFDLQVYRILIDIPYNFAGTINLGAAVATTPWLAHHDLDHVITPELLGHVLSFARPEHENSMFRFRIRFSDGRVVLSSSAYLIAAEWFWRLGGADEDFAGSYGFDDVHFLARAERAEGLAVIETDHDFIAHGDGACEMERDYKRNELLFQDKLHAASDHTGQILRFPWKRVL